MKVIILSVLVFILATTLGSTVILTVNADKIQVHEADSLNKALHISQERLIQCSECCNQMNIRMSEWYVRKDSIIYDFYVRSMKR